MPTRGRSRLERGQVVRVQRRNKPVCIRPDTDAFGENVPVHRHARIEVRAEQTIVFRGDATEIDAHPRHAADAVGQQNQVRWTGRVGLGFRVGALLSRSDRPTDPADFAGQKPDRSRNPLLRDPISFREQFGVACFGARRKTGELSVLDRNRPRVPPGFPEPETQRHAERHRVLNQQPVVWRNQGDATPVNQAPGDDLGEFLLCRRLIQGGEQIRFFVQARDGPEKAFRIALDPPGQGAPIMRTSFLRVEYLTERADGPGRLSARAAIGVAIGLPRLRRRREAVTGAGVQRERRFAVGGLFALGRGLVQHVPRVVERKLRHVVERVPGE